MDEIEKEYLRAIAVSESRGNCDDAQYLVIGLREYRELYKIDGK